MSNSNEVEIKPLEAAFLISFTLRTPTDGLNGKMTMTKEIFNAENQSGLITDFKSVYENYSEIKRLIRTKGLEIIKAALVQNEGKISFREIYDENECGEILSVIYDGGNHPEYNANPFSTVNGLYLKNDNIVIDCEDCDEYYIDSVGVEDISSIANYLVENSYIN